jgi:hypothetical protein
MLFLERRERKFEEVISSLNNLLGEDKNEAHVSNCAHTFSMPTQI